MKQGTLVILELLKAAVVKFNRPVCYGDLLEFSRNSADFPAFGIRRIKDDVRRLLIVGEILKAGNNIGNNKGRFVYLPINVDVSKAELLQTASPIQIVETAFTALWNERVLKANTEVDLPKPILTNDIYQYLVAKNLKFGDKRTLPNTLLHLSQKQNAPIRKIKRQGEHFTAWVPLGISNSEVTLNGIYGSDSERIKVAVKRCVNKLDRAVCAGEILDEVNVDPNLQLTGSASLAVQLNGLTKEKSYIKGKLINRHRHSIIRKAGQFNGTAYYFYGTKKDEIKYLPFVEFLNLRQQWEQSNAQKHLDEIEGCKLPTVAAGRALLVKAEAEKLLAGVENIINSFLPSETKYEAEVIRKEISKLITLAKEWIETKNIQALNLPSSVDTFTPGITAKELLKIIKPFYPKAQKIKDPNKLIGLLYGDVRRVPNPNFKGRFSSNSNESSSFLFDKTDALLFIALNWGGLESNFQANLAKSELGNLRDVRFIVPALTSKSFDVRLSAVACLAFLQNKQGKTYLEKLRFKDSDPNIRKSATWAYDFGNNLYL